MSGRRSGIARWQLGVAAVAAGLLLAGLVWLAEGLRHPGANSTALPSTDEETVDPRIEVECPEPQPREGEPRTTRGAVGSRPQEVSSTDLNDCPESYDRSLVSLQGEVVGPRVRRAAAVWVRLNDDPYAQGLGPLPSHREYEGANEGVAVLVPSDALDRVGTIGGPGRRGDVVEVTGFFHRVDPDTGEVAVIRAQEVDLVLPGAAVDEPRVPGRERAAALLAALAIGSVAAERLHARRWHRG